jgi:hypothetical protein
MSRPSQTPAVKDYPEVALGPELRSTPTIAYSLVTKIGQKEGGSRTAILREKGTSQLRRNTFEIN